MFRFAKLARLLPLLLLSLSTFAHAGLSEIRYQGLNRTSALSATSVVTVGSFNGTYLACLYLEQPGSTAAMTGTLSWTDENGDSQSFTPANVQNVDGLPNWSAQGCTLARVEANTSLNVSVSGTPNPNYSVSAGGFGFWPGQPQKQGGIAEIYNSEPYGCYETSLSPGLYLVAVNNPLSSGGYVSWIDDFSGTDSNEASIGSGLVMMFRVASATSDNFFACPEPGGNVSLISLGIPATGSGPLIDYEWNVPTASGVYNGGFTMSNASAVNALFAATLAEEPNMGGGPIELDGCFWVNSGTCTETAIFTATDSGAPVRTIYPLALGADAGFSGTLGFFASPAYSLETGLITF